MIDNIELDQIAKRCRFGSESECVGNLKKKIFAKGERAKNWNWKFENTEKHGKGNENGNLKNTKSSTVQKYKNEKG